MREPAARLCPWHPVLTMDMHSQSDASLNCLEPEAPMT